MYSFCCKSVLVNGLRTLDSSIYLIVCTYTDWLLFNTFYPSVVHFVSFFFSLQAFFKTNTISTIQVYMPFLYSPLFYARSAQSAAMTSALIALDRFYFSCCVSSTTLLLSQHSTKVLCHRHTLPQSINIFRCTHSTNNYLMEINEMNSRVVIFVFFFFLFQIAPFFYYKTNQKTKHHLFGTN